MSKTYTIREGDRLWRLICLIGDTYIDDIDDARLRQLETLVRSWRVTHADGSRLSGSEQAERDAAIRDVHR
jgi:hypothetical protein